jgi:transposase-like protein
MVLAILGGSIYAVKLAVESEQSMAQTARDLGVHENTLHTWIGKYHRAERQNIRNALNLLRFSI